MNIVETIYLIYIFFLFAESLYFYQNILTINDQISHPFREAMIIQIILAMTLYIAFDDACISSIITFLSLLLPCLFLFQGSISSRICGFFLAYASLFIAELLACFLFFIVAVFYPEKGILPGNLVTESFPLFLVYMCTMLFLTMGIHRFFIKKIRTSWRNLTSPWFLKLGAAINLLLLLTNTFGAISNQTLFWIFTPVYFGISIFCLFLLNTTLKDFRRKQQENIQIELKKQQIHQQLLHYENMNAEYQNIRKWNHDLSNHLLSLALLIDQEQFVEADAYIQTLLSKCHHK